MDIQRANPNTVAPPVGPYSQTVKVTGGADWLFISGQIGVDQTGTMPPDIYSQTLNVFESIEKLLAAEGLGPASIVRLLTFLVGEDNGPEFRRARGEVFDRWFPHDKFPGQSFAFVPALARADVLLEIEAWAVVSSDWSTPDDSVPATVNQK